MKKKRFILLTFAAAMICISAYAGYRLNVQSNQSQLFDFSLSECEALAGCEVYNSNGEVVVSCEGDSGVC